MLSPQNILWLICVLGVCSPASAAKISEHLKKPDSWFQTADARQIGANILSNQSETGSWPKNGDTTIPFKGNKSELHGTFDNGATTDELRFLARLMASQSPVPGAAVNGLEPWLGAFLRGYDHILAAQYPTGGWPQFYPPSRQYHRHITFNDNAMARLMEFLRESYSSDRYLFVDAGRREKAKAAFQKGVECILKCQIRQDGKLTAWCAQHDEVSLEPRPARTFELASLSGAESVGLVRLLISIEHPDVRIKEAVESAAAWFDAVKIKGIRVVQKPDPQSPKGWNKVVVQDPNAPPIWARFYELGTNKPLFADRDGKPRYTLAELGYERRNGYAWYGEWPAKLLGTELAAWRARWP